ncbi:MAG TPA: hypothetical protein PLY87_17195 [Planctomycetaceae bacterium]|nr:hypothetical protein [Planctomycetaceae bacterium]HQZ66833.1 hypothetical protein [Planctomycetaceae bacterium]HRA87424.1 hypothetical protein [Planctomycetaceae bacterium]
MSAQAVRIMHGCHAEQRLRRLVFPQNRCGFPLTAIFKDVSGIQVAEFDVVVGCMKPSLTFASRS